MAARSTIARRRFHVFRKWYLFILTPLLAVLCVSTAPAQPNVHPLFKLGSIEGSPFPSNQFTTVDADQITGLRINLSLPPADCAARPSDCEDINNVLNKLDGFNLLPRISISFDGPIDLTTVNSVNIFLVNLDSMAPGGQTSPRKIGIDQVVSNSTKTTVYVESNELLDQHTRYALVVTKGVQDLQHHGIKGAKDFLDFVDESQTTSTGDPLVDAYRSSVRDALTKMDSGEIPRGQVVAASVFTTLSASAILEKMRVQIKSAPPPAPANFMMGPNGTLAVYPLEAIDAFEIKYQKKTDPAADLTNQPVPWGALKVVPDKVGRIAFGRYKSPEYREPGGFIPQVGTLSGVPAVQKNNDITFVLFLPTSQEPQTGYPVAIYGPGGATDKLTGGYVAAKLAEKGIATIAIDAPGAGFGPKSEYRFKVNGVPTTLISGGRGADRNGDGKYMEDEGFAPVTSMAMLGQGRGDGQRQWAVDHMQLVRVIQAGIDLGDGGPMQDLDPSRIYYVGPSSGGVQGAIFLAVEPDVRAGVLNSPGNSIESSLSSRRERLGSAFQLRKLWLINTPGIAEVDGIAVTPPRFNDNYPLRGEAAHRDSLENGSIQIVRSRVVNTVDGALEIQEAMERAEWANQQASVVTYASFLRRHPLKDVLPKAVIIQFPFGDRLIPNPATTLLIHAGDLPDRTTFFRSDLRFEENPIPQMTQTNFYPHVFLNLFFTVFLNSAAVRDLTLQAQGQIAAFFALDGNSHALNPTDPTQISDPDDPNGKIFEVPIQQPLPLRLNYPMSGSIPP